MKTKIISFLLCIVLLLALASPAAAADVPTELDIADGAIVLGTHPEECPGHIITGTSQNQNNIQILSGDHKITLKDLSIPLLYPSPDTLDNDDTLKKFSALYIAEGVNNVDITIEDYVMLVGYKAISAGSTNLTFHGTESSDFNVTADIIGIEAKNITIDGGNLTVSAAGSGALESRIGIAATENLTIKNAYIFTGAGAATNSYAIIAKDLTIENSRIEASSGIAENGTSVGITFANSINVKDSDIRVSSKEGIKSIGIYGSDTATSATFQNVTLTARPSKGGEISAGIYMSSGTATINDSEIDLRASSSDKDSYGALFNNLIISGSILYTDGGNAKNESAGLFTTETLTAENSLIDASGGNDAQYSYGIYATNALNATDSTITGNGGKATSSSFGIEVHEADITNGLIAGYGSDECEASYGISILSFDDDLGFFKLTNANIIAWGNMNSVRETNMDFPGITYQADENAEPVTTRDYSGKEFYFGNKYKVIYDANGVEVEVPATAKYYVNEGFEVNTDPLTAEGYTFLGWSEDPEATIPEYEVDEAATCIMDSKDITLYAIWQYIPKIDEEAFDSEPTYRPSIEETTGGDTSVNKKNPEKGDKVTITTDPDKGYEVEAVIVTDKNGNEIEVIDNGDGTYTFKQPAGKVTIEVIYAEVEAEPAFDDVDEDDYYFDAVNWAVENGITNGVGTGIFAPDQICTRAQVVTFLWRAAGSPEPERMVMPFTDVAEGSYYYKAVLWAVENGITNGTSANTFSPNATVTRGQTVTFLWRAEGEEESDEENVFTDVAEGAYYNDAVLWAVENGITNGTSATTFSPENGCTRGQIVTFMYRAMK